MSLAGSQRPEQLRPILAQLGPTQSGYLVLITNLTEISWNFFPLPCPACHVFREARLPPGHLAQRFPTTD